MTSEEIKLKFSNELENKKLKINQDIFETDLFKILYETYPLKNLKTLNFIYKSILIHGYKYNYDEVIYLGVFKKVKIYCNTCKEFFYQSPVHHLRKYGCKKCGYIIASNKKTSNKNEFEEKANKVHNKEYTYPNFVYIDENIKSWITCYIHGDFLQSAHNHLRNHGCPKCGFNITKKKLSYNKNEFEEKANIVHSNEYTYPNFIHIDNKTKSWITCSIHGDFLQNPNNHLNGKGCPKCGIKKRTDSIKSNKEEFEIKSNVVHNKEYTYPNFVYVDCKTKGYITCSIHGDFLQSPSNHLKGRGCPKCNSSKGEKRIFDFLKNINILFKNEKCFLDCKDKYFLRFDFYIPEFNICIEYDGIQHFKPIKRWGSYNGLAKNKKHDKIKTEYCQNNNIQLIRIPYTKFNKIEEILTNYFRKYKLKKLNIII